MPAHKLFLDASYLIALAVPADQHHRRAVELLQAVEKSVRLLVTTQAILFEVGDGLCDKRYREAAARLLNGIAADPKVTVVNVDDELYRRALDLFQGRLDKEWSLTDCLSFIIMKDYRLTESLTTDQHFEQAGFTALLRG